MKSIYRKYFATIALVWAGCFVLCFFVYMLVLSPQRKTREQVEQRLAEKRQICESAQKASQEESILKIKEQIEHLRDGLKDFAVDFEDSANLTFDISQIANAKEVSSFRIKTRESRKGSSMANCNYICENRIDVSFIGNFNQFATFLNSLERHRPVVFVDKFTIIRSDRDDSGHKVSMDLAVFVRKRQES